MLDVVRRGLEEADDVRIAVSFTRCSGLGLLVDSLRDVAERDGRVRILTSTYQSVTQPEALETLLALPGVETRVQTGAVGSAGPAHRT
jgi:HKD family nuclease